jgi:hypothetical protein
VILFQLCKCRPRPPIWKDSGGKARCKRCHLLLALPGRVVHIDVIEDWIYYDLQKGRVRDDLIRQYGAADVERVLGVA